MFLYRKQKNCLNELRQSFTALLKEIEVSATILLNLKTKKFEILQNAPFQDCKKLDSQKVLEVMAKERSSLNIKVKFSQLSIDHPKNFMHIFKTIKNFLLNLS